MRFLRFFLLSLALGLVACSGLGVSSPVTFNQKVYAAAKTVDTLAASALAARQAGKLSDSDKDNLVQTLNSSLVGLRVATQLNQTDPAAAQTRLDMTVAVLTALQGYLATKGAVK